MEEEQALRCLKTQVLIKTKDGVSATQATQTQ